MLLHATTIFASTEIITDD